MRISDWSSDVCSSDLFDPFGILHQRQRRPIILLLIGIERLPHLAQKGLIVDPAIHRDRDLVFAADTERGDLEQSAVDERPLRRARPFAEAADAEPVGIDPAGSHGSRYGFLDRGLDVPAVEPVSADRLPIFPFSLFFLYRERVG